MSELAKEVKGQSRMATVWGILTIILGVIAMGAPFASGMAVAMVFGFILIFGGVAQTIYAFSATSFGKGLLRFLFGGITLLAGVYCVAQPGMAAAALALALAVYLVVDGVFVLLAAVVVEENKLWFVVSGLLSLVLGVLLWQDWPLTGIMAIGILLGVRLLFSGLMMVMIGSAGRQLSKNIDAA